MRHNKKAQSRAKNTRQRQRSRRQAKRQNKRTARQAKRQEGRTTRQDRRSARKEHRQSERTKRVAARQARKTAKVMQKGQSGYWSPEGIEARGDIVGKLADNAMDAGAAYMTGGASGLFGGGDMGGYADQAMEFLGGNEEYGDYGVEPAGTGGGTSIMEQKWFYPAIGVGVLGIAYLAMKKK